MIGNCETAALVHLSGSIDWLCLPRFDSSACFAALLGDFDHGRWLITPSGKIKSIDRRYIKNTLILETEFQTDTGNVLLQDFMSIDTNSSDIVRIVKGISGQVNVLMELVIRFDYGSVIPWVRSTPDGLRAIAGPNAINLNTPVKLVGRNMTTIANFTVHQGEEIPFTLRWFPSHHGHHFLKNPFDIFRTTSEFWQKWSSRCQYQGQWQEQVQRSLITLKALTYAPTGGIVAAVTTSLPEQLGSVRNWDYRYCWLRDATFTLYALMVGGYREEAKAWREWLLRAIAGDPAKMQIMYGLSGERWLEERNLSWLPGYEDSTPVRIGNAASEQHQLDVYGEVMDSLYFANRTKITNEKTDSDEDAWRIERALMDFIESDWRKVDNGIWEMRGRPRHFTHSKVMAWVAVDRAIKSCDRFGLDGPMARWQKLRDEIHEETCRKGFHPKLNSFTQSFDSEELDASLLMLSLVGFLPANDPKMVGTVEAIQSHLMVDGLVRRYVTKPSIDGLPEGEGAFLACSFWLADNLALQGRYEEAKSLFERLLSLCNDVGLLSEAYDTQKKRQLGNFPQAFSHVGIINTARNLTNKRGPSVDRPQY